MICLFHFPSLQPCIDATFLALMQSFIHTTFEVASMQLHRRKVASMRLFQNDTEHSTYRRQSLSNGKGRRGLGFLRITPRLISCNLATAIRYFSCSYSTCALH